MQLFVQLSAAGVWFGRLWGWGGAFGFVSVPLWVSNWTNLWEDGVYFFLAWLLHVSFFLGFTRASGSCRFPLLACLVPPLSRVTFQVWHGPHLTLFSQQHGLLSSLSTKSFCLACRLTSWEVVWLQNSFKWKLKMCEEIQNNTETMMKIITKVSWCMMASPSTVLIVVISPLARLQHTIGS